MKNIIITLAFFSSSTLASGLCKELPPVQDFLCNSKNSFEICSLKIENNLLKGLTADSGAFSCISEYKSVLKPLYNNAKKKLDGNSSATNALKKVYASWISSMGMLMSSDYLNDRNAYRKKIEGNRLEMTELITLLELEVE